MATLDLARSPRPAVVSGPPLTMRPAAGAFIAMMFGLTVLVFLLGLLALSM
jgi:hypothetical protein